MRQRVRSSALAFIAAAALVWGCGGGGPSTPATSGGQGRVALTIQFPPVPTRQTGGGIPIGTNAVKVAITDPSTGANLAQPQVVTRPPTGNAATVSFALIRAGAIRVTATAYADTSATQPLGMGQVDGVVTAGGTTTLNLPLTLGPVASLVITPSSLQLIAAPGAPPSSPALTTKAPPITAPGGLSSTTVHASVFDGSSPPNQLLGFPIAWSSSDPTVATVIASPTDSSTAVVQAIGFGTATITASELNTGKTASITVNVPLEATLNMSVGRYYHTATLLSDGTVLVAGGFGPQGTAISEADVYAPARRTFNTPFGATLNTPRAGHTATLLPDGTVLLAGGEDQTGASLSTAEVFNGSDSFDLTANTMNSPRVFHTATLLNDGTVLIAGGEAIVSGFGNSLASAETYDPMSQSFTATRGSMATPRAHAAAVLLGDGSVLEIGGANIVAGAGTAVATIERYNPASRKFTAVGTLNTARSSPTATLLPDGNVLVTGGDNPATGAPLNTAEVFNPGTGAIVKTATMSAARSGHQATLLPNGTVLISGGGVPTAEIYTPSTNTFSGVVTMTGVRTNHTSTLLNDGTVLLAGGAGANGQPLPTAEVYHP